MEATTGLFQEECRGDSASSILQSDIKLSESRGKSVCFIYGKNSKGRVWFKTAFFVGESNDRYYIMTCYHVVKMYFTTGSDKVAFHVDFNYEERKQARPEYDVIDVLCYSDGPLDYAILEIQKPGETAPPPLGKLLSEVPKLHEEIMLIGHPGEMAAKKSNLKCRLVDASMELKKNAKRINFQTRRSI